MDSNTHSIQFSRIEVVETGRRRRWSDAEKRRIVEESYGGKHLVSATERRHGLSPSRLFAWRREFHAVDISVPGREHTEPVPVPPASEPPAGNRIEIKFPNGIRLTVDCGVDPVALHRIAKALA